MSKFLVPTDFSSGSANAANYAINLAKLFDAEVMFLHIMSIPIDWIKLSGKQNKLYPEVTKKVKNAQSKLTEWSDNAEKQGVTSKNLLHFNENYQYLVKYAKENGFDLIVMGLHGSDSAPYLLSGSTTQRVVSISSIPVLVVNKAYEPINKIAFISSFEEGKYPEQGFISGFVNSLKSELKLVYIITPLNFLSSSVIHNRQERFSKGLSCIALSYSYNDYTFEKGINNFCKGNDIDLIMMGTHKRTGLDRFISGSLTLNVIGYANVPVLSIPILTES